MVKGFGIVNKAEIDIFLELSCFFRSSKCWCFDLCFLCLFSNQLEHMEFHSSHIIEACCCCCCCCCCCVASVMSNSVRPQRRQPTRFPCPWDCPGKNTGVSCHFLLQCMKVKSESKVDQSCPTPSDPMDYSLPGSSVHGICQARVLEWVAIAFSDWSLAWRILSITLLACEMSAIVQ